MKMVRITHEIIDYGVKLINPFSVWQSSRGKNIKVAILDTGIDYNHVDLKANFVTGINFTTANRNDYMDYVGHGTFCAGLVAAAANNVGIVGVAPEASIYAVKVLDNNASGTIKWLLQGIQWCIDNNIDIINCSLGFLRDYPQLHDVVCQAYKKGIIIVAAAGNNRYANDVEYPAKYGECIAVGAIDSIKRTAKFSTPGRNLEIVAPGVDLISTFIRNQYAQNSGTSFSCPLITGAIALIQSKIFKESGKKLNTLEIRDFLHSHCEDLSIKGRDVTTGYGLFKFD